MVKLPVVGSTDTNLLPTSSSIGTLPAKKIHDRAANGPQTAIKVGKKDTPPIAAILVIPNTPPTNTVRPEKGKGTGPVLSSSFSLSPSELSSYTVGGQSSGSSQSKHSPLKV